MQFSVDRTAAIASHAACIVAVALGLRSDAATADEHLTQSALNSRSENPVVGELFTELSSESTGVVHRQKLDWNGPMGILYYTGFACGGVAVGDLDHNGLPDLLLLGGAEPNRLYFQTNPLKFEDRTTAAGLKGDAKESLGSDGWSAGAAIFDVDNDGDLDIYICNYDSANRLYVNRGDGTFDERGKLYGLDILDASLMPAICDYDRDGDVDVYLAVNRYMDEQNFDTEDLFYQRDGQEYLRPEAEKLFAIVRHPNQSKQVNMWIGGRDRLLRNEGPGRKFTDVTDKCLVVGRADTLSATWWDYDHDGWPDLYVCNDLAAPDALYHNNGDGTFTNVAEESLPHTPWSAMGSSAGDVNGDGLVDFLAADMAFRTHYKDKVLMSNMSTKFDNIRYFPGDQLMRNALFINTGTRHFQEAAYASGLASTDWTWTAKLADLDNDGRLDAYFTNGTPVSLSAPESLLLSNTSGIDTGHTRRVHANLPPVTEQNLAFRNAGNLKFHDVSAKWGLDHVGMSYAAAHVDLDRDGDLDLVVANLDENVAILRNDSRDAHAALIQLRGMASNRDGIGAEVVVETNARKQVQQLYPVAGFLACQEATLHFGLGDATRIEKLTITWPSGIVQTFADLEVDHLYQISEPDRPANLAARRRTAPQPLMRQIEPFALIEHHEEPFDDFARQPLLPNKLSQFGPPMASGDIDGDGDQDLFVGEGAGWMGMLYVNDGAGGFAPSPHAALADDAGAEDMAATFADFDGDGDTDLYVASGSVECEPGDQVLHDRLYLNDGQGKFARASTSWLPAARNSSGCVAPCDFDQDGDVDLFVGSRSIPGKYPLAPEHQLLRNEGDHFVDVLAEIAAEVADAGMITAAVWSDGDGDGWQDLLVAVDWGPVRYYENRQGRLVERTHESGLSPFVGWWCSLAAADLDDDGDNDLVAGNFGLNTKYQASPEKPVMIYYGTYGPDEGGNGKPRLIEASYEDDVLFPIRGKSCSSAAMPFLKEKFPTYEQFAKATLVEVYTPKCLEDAQRFEVNTLASGCFLNDGNGKFEFSPLPQEVQLAPVYAVALDDFDGDGIVDAFLGQNFFHPQSETGEMDGGVSVVALGNGDGAFRAVRPDFAGVVLPTDVTAAVRVDLNGDGQMELLVASNDDRVAAFRRTDGHVNRENIASRDGQGFQTSLPVAPRTSAPTPEGAAWVRLNLGLAKDLLDAGNPDDALPAIRRILKVEPQNVDALLSLAGIYRDARRFADCQKLIDRLRSTPDAGKSGQHAAEVDLAQARLFHSMKRFDEAEPILAKAVESLPHNAKLHFFLAETLVQQGRLDEAQQHYSTAVEQGFTAAKTRLQQATAQRQKAGKNYREALRLQVEGDDKYAAEFYRRALAADSRDALTLNNLAWLLAATENDAVRDLWLAKQLAEQAKEVSGVREPAVLDTLAMVYAANGEFEKAAATTREILALPAVKDDVKKKADAENKLEAYAAGRLPNDN